MMTVVFFATAALAQTVFLREQMGELCDIGATDTAAAITGGIGRYSKQLDALPTCRLARLTVGADWRTTSMLMKGPEFPPDTAPGAVWAWRNEAIKGPVAQIWSMERARITVQIEGPNSRAEGWDHFDRTLFGSGDYRLMHFTVSTTFSGKSSELYVRVSRGSINQREAYRVCRLLQKELGLMQYTTVFFGREPFFIDSDSFPSNNPSIVRKDLTYEQSKRSYVKACFLRRGQWQCP